MSERIENELEEDDESDEDFNENDYGFIIGPDGELKTLMIPEDLMDDPPTEVKKILRIFGIKNIHQIEPRTIH
jgi:hypothetical protein